MASDQTDRPFLGTPPRSLSVGAAAPDGATSGSSYLSGLISQKLQDAQSSVRITEGYEFDHFKTINKIELYRASRFVEGNTDTQGNKKYFFNISNAPAGNVTKNIDLDSADITIQAEDGAFVLSSYLYRERLKQWMKENGIGFFLNKIAENLPVYGQCVAKKEGDKTISFVPLRDLFRDPSISGIQRSSFVAQRHRLQPDDLLKKVKDGWDKDAVAKVVKAFHEGNQKQVTVYEFYGWGDAASLKAEFPDRSFAGSGYVKIRTFVAMDMPVPSQDPKDAQTFNAVLHVMPWNESWPFKELNMFEIEGRALGLGIFELLFDVQQRKNEMANQKARSMEIGSKHIFQTRALTIENNVLSDILDGQIIQTTHEITPIATEERNLSAYTQEENNIRELARDLANAQEVLTGDGLPSRTPYRLGALLAQNASKLLEYIQEKFGLFLEEMINDWIIPKFEKEMDVDFVMELNDPELLEKVVEADVNRRYNAAAKDFFFSFGDFPGEEEADLMRRTIKKDYQGKQFAKVKKGMFAFPKRVRVVVTNEGLNVKQQIESLSNLIQTLGQNPQVTTNPTTAKLVTLLLERIGIAPTAISSSQVQEAMPTPSELAGGAKEAGMDASLAAALPQMQLPGGR